MIEGIDKSLFELPKRIYFDITNFCNLSCRMCPQGYGLIENKGSMDFSLYKKVIDDIESIEDYHPIVALHVNGEPLLHKKLVDMVTYASKRKLYVLIHTNGVLLDEEKGRQLVQAGISEISFSFEGEDPEFYEKMRLKSNYEQVKKNIQKFLAIKESTKVVIEVLKFRGVNKNLEISEKFKKKFEGAEFSSFYASDWRGTLNLPELSEREIRHEKPSICGDMRNVLVLSWEGKVQSCCIDYNSQMIIGDINKQTLLEVWHGDKRLELLKIMGEGRHNELKLCSTCSAPYTVNTKERKKESQLMPGL